MSLVNELVGLATDYQRLKTQCGGELTITEYDGMVRMFISPERFAKLFDLYKVQEVSGTTWKYRTVECIEFFTPYKKEEEKDDF